MGGMAFLAIIVALLLWILVIPALLRWLWNMTIPELLQLSEITHWQAFRLILIVTLLFGGAFGISFGG